MILILYNLCISNCNTLHVTDSGQVQPIFFSMQVEKWPSLIFNRCHIQTTGLWCTMPSHGYLNIFGPTWLGIFDFWPCVVVLEPLIGILSGRFSWPSLPFRAFLPMVSRDVCNICYGIGTTKCPCSKLVLCSMLHALYPKNCDASDNILILQDA